MRTQFHIPYPCNFKFIRLNLNPLKLFSIHASEQYNETITVKQPSTGSVILHNDIRQSRGFPTYGQSWIVYSPIYIFYNVKCIIMHVGPEL